MKKTLIALVMMLPALSYAQGNGGISNENASTKIEWVSHSQNGQYVVRVTNKQNCTAEMRVQWGGTNQFRAKTMSSGASDTFHITPPPTPRCFLGAKPNTSCTNTTEMGTVEINVCNTLPVKFSSITGQRVGPRSVKLVFVAEEDANTSYYNIQYSLNGKTFTTIKVLFPNGVEGNKTYSVIVNY